MKINVSSVMRNVTSSIEADGEVSIPFIEYGNNNIKVLSPIKVHVVVTNNGKNLTVSGNISSKLMLNCSRCLKDFEYTLDTDFEEELSNKDDGGDAIHFDGDTVDLTDMVIDNILLSLPMKTVCSEECKGLCPRCGSNLNIKECNCSDEDHDPRFSVLKDLLKGN
jgi:uncharacterized protein